MSLTPMIHRDLCQFLQAFQLQKSHFPLQLHFDNSLDNEFANFDKFGTDLIWLCLDFSDHNL